MRNHRVRGWQPARRFPDQTMAGSCFARCKGSLPSILATFFRIRSCRRSISRTALIDRRSLPPDQPAEIAPRCRRGGDPLHRTQLSGAGESPLQIPVGRIRPDWVDAGTAAFLPINASLPAGSYSFRVIACNNDGVWKSRLGASFAFRLRRISARPAGSICCVWSEWPRDRRVNELRVIGLKVREKELQARVAEAVGDVRYERHVADAPAAKRCATTRDIGTRSRPISASIRTRRSATASVRMRAQVVPGVREEILPGLEVHRRARPGSEALIDAQPGEAEPRTSLGKSESRNSKSETTKNLKGRKKQFALRSLKLFPRSIFYFVFEMF